jgi:hypothetical protein
MNSLVIHAGNERSESKHCHEQHEAGEEKRFSRIAPRIGGRKSAAIVRSDSHANSDRKEYRICLSAERLVSRGN